ncbi:signal peptidase I [Sporosarcina sp. NCCP-2716]|uniref:signal peptidase I n=1 Tax=Sporosarcina sp. NCCP-2716 TaxID=2943679 RepID=UPI0020416006|nr:signal peptidase I [Sporosarcina sp. NCCP-2716]GKV67778.1 signal peptidase I [Sporosarcina sp. NCCP-2716]
MNEQEEKSETFEWVKALLIAFGIAAIIRLFVFTPIVVDGISMMPTLVDGDKMIVNKISYTVGKPDHFDIVVFHAPEKKDYIKRVIGLPGDEIEYADDVLYINGVAQKEPYLDAYKKELAEGTLTEDFTLEEKIGSRSVPEGHVFVMGDNRRKSRDSRHIGVVSTDDIIGTTKFVFWPIKDFGPVE